jgi:hypothetical protein
VRHEIWLTAEKNCVLFQERATEIELSVKIKPEVNVKADRDKMVALGLSLQTSWYYDANWALAGILTF